MATLISTTAQRARLPGRVAVLRSAGLREFRTLLVALPVIVTIVGGMAAGSTALTLLGSVAALGVAVLSPATGLAILAFMAPLKPPPVIPAPGFDLAIAAAVCLGCLYRLPIDRPTLRPSPAFWFLAAFLFYVFAQQTPEMLTGWAPGPAHDVGYRFFQVLAGFVALVGAAYVFRQASPFPVIAMAIGGALVAALLAIATFGATSVGPPLAGLMAIPDSQSRALGPFGNPNYMGAFAAMTVAALVGLLAGARSRTIRVVLVVIALPIAFAVALSLSRGAIVALLAGVACVAWWRSRKLALALVALALIGVAVIYPAFVDWRLTNLRGVVTAAGYAAMTASDDGRLTGLLVGPQIFLSAPLFGVGFAHYEAASVAVGGLTSPINAHNWYMEVLAEQGLIGAMLWIAIGVAVVREMLHRPPLAQVAGFSALGALGAAGFFLEVPISFQTVALPLLVITAALAGAWRVEPLTRGGAESAAAQSAGLLNTS